MSTAIEQKRDNAYRMATLEIQELYGNVELGGILGSLIDKFGIIENNRKIFIHVTGDIILGFHPKSQIIPLLIEKVGVSEAVAKEMSEKILPLLAQLPETPGTAVSETTIPIRAANEMPVVSPVIPVPVPPVTPTPVVVPIPSPIPQPPKIAVIPHSFEPAPEYKERLELRPQGVPIGGISPQATTEEKRETPDSNAVKPLTREELMNALATKRTMASDIEAIRMKREGVKEGSTPSVNTPPTPPSPVVK